MSKTILATLSGLVAILAAGLTISCNNKSAPPSRSQPGTVVIFGSDAPICNVESFVVTITSANLVPQGGGTPVALISSTAPATVDFARLAGFTSILDTASVTQAGAYSGLQVTLTNPQLVILDTSTNPPSPQIVPVTLTSATPSVTINPPLVITSAATSGFTLDFNVLQSLQLQVSGTGQTTATVDPQISVTPATSSGTTLGEATALFGILQSLSTTASGNFTGSFDLALSDGTEQTVTILTNSSTVFEGDGVTGLSNLAPNTFVEVDAIVNSSGQIVAQIVDSEEPVSAASQKSAFLGKVIDAARDASGNATSFTLLVNDEIPDLSGTVSLHAGLTVTLASTTNYFTNWQYLNREAFTFGPQTLGLGQTIAVFGVLGSGSPLTLAASQVFLRPRSLLGNFQVLRASQSDGVTGGFSMIPCGGLFAGNGITVLTSSNTIFTGLGGLTALTPAPTLDTMGLLFYLQKIGESSTGVLWSAPTWIMQAGGVHQLPN